MFPCAQQIGDKGVIAIAMALTGGAVSASEQGMIKEVLGGVVSAQWGVRNNPGWILAQREPVSVIDCVGGASQERKLPQEEQEFT